MSFTLRRIGVICTDEGEVSLKSDSSNKILNISKYFKDAKYFEESPATANNEVEKYHKRNIFLPFYDMLTANSIQNMQHQGIQIESLNGQRVYCKPGVHFESNTGMAADLRSSLQSVRLVSGRQSTRHQTAERRS